MTALTDDEVDRVVAVAARRIDGTEEHLAAVLVISAIGVGGAAFTLLIGTVFAPVGGSPVQAIVFAQATNGVLLPIVALFLVIVMNRGDLLGEHVNSARANLLGGIVVLVTAVLGIASLSDAAGTLTGA